MDNPHGLTSEDHAFRRAAHAYFTEKGALAENWSDPRQLSAFKAFSAHWRDYFAPEDPIALNEYLAMPFAQRQSHFERFKRACHSWEVSFKLMARESPTNGATRPKTIQDDFHRRLEHQHTREAEVRELYANLDEILDRQKRQVYYPPEIMVHLRILGVGAGASLEEIKKQYKKLAKIHHPDKSGDEIKMQKLNSAFRAVISYYKR